MEWMKTQYQVQRDNWVPWIEDMYLKYFTSDNKASYSTKGMTLQSIFARLNGLRHIL